ncbi:MAG: 4-hydroxybenzoate octaprenyltransferase [Pseudomonadota bacterium]
MQPSKDADTMPAPAMTGVWAHILPSALIPYARLLRLDRPIGWWLLLLPCWWGVLLAGPGILSLDVMGWYLLVLFLVGAVAMRGAGCLINDFWDRNFDAQVARTATRPLVTGDVPIWGAVITLILTLFIGAIVLVQLSGTAITIALLSIILVVLYPLMKRITWWPQAVLGLTFNIGTLIGWAAVQGQVDSPAWLLYAAGFFWTMGYDTIYGHQDKVDDKKLGLKSTALLFGVHSKLMVFLFYTLTAVFMAMAVWWVGVPLGLAASLVAPIGVLLLIQVWFWQPDIPETCWDAFAANRDIGLLYALVCALCFIPFGPG